MTDRQRRTDRDRRKGPETETESETEPETRRIRERQRRRRRLRQRNETRTAGRQAGWRPRTQTEQNDLTIGDSPSQPPLPHLSPLSLSQPQSQPARPMPSTAPHAHTRTPPRHAQQAPPAPQRLAPGRLDPPPRPGPNQHLPSAGRPPRCPPSPAPRQTPATPAPQAPPRPASPTLPPPSPRPLAGLRRSHRRRAPKRQLTVGIDFSMVPTRRRATTKTAPPRGPDTPAERPKSRERPPPGQTTLQSWRRPPTGPT